MKTPRPPQLKQISRQQDHEAGLPKLQKTLWPQKTKRDNSSHTTMTINGTRIENDVSTTYLGNIMRADLNQKKLMMTRQLAAMNYLSNLN